jgi:long-chain acyl-CoA synthetase
MFLCIIQKMNLASAFADSIKKRPEKVAVYWGEREYSYSELGAQTLWMADHLEHQFGIRPGDRVGLWLKNCPEFIPSFFGILAAGAVAVPINNFLKCEEVNYILKDAGIDILITDAELGTHFRSLSASRPQLKMLKIEEISQTASASEARTNRLLHKEASAVDPSQLAVLIYTSGTTGRPKGAMLSHRNLMHNVESCRIVLQTVDVDRFAVLLPLFHSYMLTVGLLLPLIVGGSIVLVKSLHPVRNVVQEIFQRKASVLPAIPLSLRRFRSGCASAAPRLCQCRS